MRNQHDARAWRAAGPLAAIAAGTCLAVSGCGGATAGSGAAPSTPGGAARPAAVSSSAPTLPTGTTGSLHLTGNLCPDAAAANSEFRAITEALVTNPGGRQQKVAKLLTTVVAIYTALESEAPGPLRVAFARLAGFYRAAGNRLASGGGQLALADIEAAAHRGLAPAVHQIVSYSASHCAG